MSKHPHKDFGPIADDYDFFQRHATEAAADARAYVDRLRSLVPETGPVRMLDFGCGAGTFTATLLHMAPWPAERLHLTLVEPVENARRQAELRMAEFSTHPIASSAELPVRVSAGFDVVVANHVLYYVPDLQRQLAGLIASLAPGGVFVTAIAGRANALIEFWSTAFALIGQEIPHYISEDVEDALKALGIVYEKRPVEYELTFPDTEENRLSIIRFLLADYLPRLPLPTLQAMFDRYRVADWIEINTHCDHYTVPRLPPGLGGRSTRA